MTREEASILINTAKAIVVRNTDCCEKVLEALDMAISALSENKGESKHGHWVRMSDLPEDKDDRYKCSRCGNVVHHSSGVNLYHFNSWCGACGSLNNSLLAGLEPIEEKGE